MLRLPVEASAGVARHAEAVFTAQQTLEDALAFYRDLKLRTAAMGRHSGLLILNSMAM